MRPKILFAILLAIFISLAVGCSGSSSVSPVVPDEPSRTTDDNQHVLWGYYTMYIDLESGAIDVAPNRGLLAHKNVKQYVSPPACMDCLNPVPTGPYQNNILPLNITLKNPTILTGYDVRGILFAVDGEIDLLNPDDYVDFYSPNVNPFRAYAKEIGNRAFGAGESFTEFFELYLSGFGKIAQIDYAIDASWPGRAKEPYQIDGPFLIGTLDDQNQNELTVNFDVFAAGDDVNEVLLDLSELGYTEDVPMAFDSGATWSVNITNENMQPVGEYMAWVKASTLVSGKYLYQKFTITVEEGVPVTSLSGDVQPIFDANCTTCHGSVAPPVGLDLSPGAAYSNLVGVNSAQSSIVRVEPGNSFMSYLMAKLNGLYEVEPFNGSGGQMPLGQDPLSPDDLKTIGSWIDQGALDN